MPTIAAQELTTAMTEQLVMEWYEALDQHAPVEELVRHVVSDGLVMSFPEGTLKGVEAFRDWYRTVTHRFFDEVHVVRSATIGPRAADGAGADVRDVQVVVNWQTRVWTPCGLAQPVAGLRRPPDVDRRTGGRCGPHPQLCRGPPAPDAGVGCALRPTWSTRLGRVAALSSG